MKLSNFLKDIFEIPAKLDAKIKGLALDSRHLKKGNLFFACKGTQQDGRQFIADAIAKGASAILAESDSDNFSSQIIDEVPVINIPHLNHRVGEMAAEYFGHPAKKLRIIGITGTNGKTSCAYFLASALQQLNIPCGVIGTLGSGMYGDIKSGSLTTPDPITLQATFADFVEQGATVVAMEVSSHSIDQGRINGIPFEVAIFTNLTRDHLDYHGDMEAYGEVKSRLFNNSLLQHSVINADDPFGLKLISTLKSSKNIHAYSINKDAQTIVPGTYADEIHLDISGLRAQIHTPWGFGSLHASVIGQFNLSNILAVVTTLCLLDFPLQKVLQALSELKSVPGRMQTLGGAEKPLVVIDYAHTPDALEKVLLALKEHCQGQLHCLFGCGGDRDKGKRPIMAKIAEQLADTVVVTDDNPRHEDPVQIVADIMRGFDNPAKITMQHDRLKAIKEIIQRASPGDCVLIAGKGAETFQQIKDKKLPFDDFKVAQQFL
jgi:UDP-N-acetylmuramoyl-L-alanyl-D-glutamate--2,6-diaminopimelate ligase